LANFAKAEFALGVRQEDGYTLRDHYKAAWRASGKKPEELKVPKMPTLVKYLWDYFLELHNRRTNYGWGHVPLSFAEIDAWERKTRRSLDPWELEALLEIDAAYLASIPKKPTKG
jgi:hypothetical protein